MKKIIFVVSIFCLFIIIGCNSKKEENKIEQFTSDEALVEEENNEQEELSNYNAKLQGVWNRTTYPYGKIIVKEDQIKFAEGEGLVEPASFQKFKIMKTCPDQNDANFDNNADFAIVTQGSNCTLVALNTDSFTIVYKGSSEGVLYIKLNSKDLSANEDFD